MPDYPLGGYSKGVMDLSEWNAMLLRLGMDDHGLRVALDPAVKQAAIESRDKIKADTPVKTGNLRDSIEEHMLAPSDHEVATAVWYAPVVESRPPGGPAKGRGAMFAQNLDYVEERLRLQVDEALQKLMGP